MKKNKLYSLAIVLLVLLFTAFFFYEATTLTINGDFTRFFPWDEGSDIYYGGLKGQKAILAMEEERIDDSVIYSQDYRTGLYASASPIVEEEEKDYPYTSTMYVLVSSPQLWTPEFLSALEEAIDEIDDRRDSARPQSILDWVTISGTEEHFGVIPMNPKEGARWTEEDALELKRRVESDPMVKYILVGGSGDSVLLQFVYADFSSEAQMDEIRGAFKTIEDMGGRVVLMSNMVIALSVMKNLSRDLLVLAGLALLVVFAVYYFSFHSFRLALLTSSVSLIALIWTLGTMAIRKMDLNLMNILTPVMVLTLGSTYSMHVINRYVSSPLSGESGFSSTKKALGTILVGSLTTIAGFFVLTFSSEEGIVSFGVSVSIGVVFCALLSTTYLPSMLTLLPFPQKKASIKVKNGIMAKAVKGVGKVVVKLWWLFLLLFIALMVGLYITSSSIPVDSNYMSYFPEGDEFGEDCKYFAFEMGGTTPFTITITAPKGSESYFLDMENLRAVREWEKTIGESEHVLNIVSFPSYVAFANREITGEWDIPTDPGVGRIMQSILTMYAKDLSEIGALVSKDFNRITITLQAWDGEKKDLSTVESSSELYSEMVKSFSLIPEGCEIEVSGYPVISTKFSNRLLSSQKTSTLYSILAVFVISSIALLSITGGLSSLVPVFGGIAMNYIFMYLLSIPFDIITISFTSIAVGAGVDDAIHFSLSLKEYRRENGKKGIRKAVFSTFKATGRTIVMTTLGTVLSMAVLGAASYTPVRYFGLLMAVTLTGCMVSTLLFLPPMHILFYRIKSLFQGKRR